jgi:hypothetical protein
MEGNVRSWLQAQECHLQFSYLWFMKNWQVGVGVT